MTGPEASIGVSVDTAWRLSENSVRKSIDAVKSSA